MLETSDDITVKKVYDPRRTPLVPIIKKDSSLRSMESIVKPSRLTEIVKQSSLNNLNRIKTLNFDTTDDREEDEEGDEVAKAVGVSPTADEDEEEDADANDDAGASSGNVAVGDKRFILPKRSLHSGREILPNKKFLDDMDGCSAKALKRVNSGSKAKAVIKTEATETNIIVPAVTVKSAIKSEPKEGADEVLLKKELAAKEVTNLFGQPVTSVGGDLNLTPFGSNKVILRQPRLQFAMPMSSSASAPPNNLFGFSTSTCSSSSNGISGDGIGSGSALSQSVAVPLKSGTLVASGECCSCGRIYSETQSYLTYTFSSCFISGSPMVCAICCSKISFNFFEKSPRKFGVNSCELCRKFISKMIKRHGMSAESTSSSYSPLQCSKSDGELIIRRRA